MFATASFNAAPMTYHAATEKRTKADGYTTGRIMLPGNLKHRMRFPIECSLVMAWSTILAAQHVSYKT